MGLMLGTALGMMFDHLMIGMVIGLWVGSLISVAKKKK